ncbi:MAG: NYN domain-containing protein [Proteobacteria bacterium]|nr:NYN domain-containing protein [Pseudomonadota bacterium]MBU1596001.1 NYN domain-containing protein [Pseudomonadota bacterium]
MQRFAFFVDGSNLYGSLRTMNLEINNYSQLYAHMYREAVRTWHEVTLQDAPASAQLRRVYWYAVGSIDDWDLQNQQSRTALRSAFVRDQEIRALWLARVAAPEAEATEQEREEAAWAACYSDFRDWYQQKIRAIDGMRRFYAGVRASSDLIDIREAGHWKVNFLHKWVEEKGLDTALAVDMVALQDNYDVAIVVSGDADAIPSIRHLKERGKHIAAVEFVGGGATDTRGRAFSSRLKIHADFVLRIFEKDIVHLDHRNKGMGNGNGSAG